VLTSAEDRHVVARIGDLRAKLFLAAREPTRIGQLLDAQTRRH
jgi:hypothetical protein